MISKSIYMDETTILYKIDNTKINKKILKKMILIYNALNDGWVVKKKIIMFIFLINLMEIKKK